MKVLWFETFETFVAQGNHAARKTGASAGGGQVGGEGGAGGAADAKGNRRAASRAGTGDGRVASDTTDGRDQNVNLITLI